MKIRCENMSEYQTLIKKCAETRAKDLCKTCILTRFCKDISDFCEVRVTVVEKDDGI